MLYPIQNGYRSIQELSGLWKFKIDPQRSGERDRWFQGFDSDLDIAVPGSWNEQLEEAGLLHYVGAAWYSKKFIVAKEFHEKRIWLRIGSADYRAKVWLNGKLIGENLLGFLPFEFEITEGLVPGEEAEVVIMVDNELSDDVIPQGIQSEQFSVEDRLREETNPPSRFDFSPFGGIHRPVQIITTPKEYIQSIRIETKVLGEHKGSMTLSVATTQTHKASLIFVVHNGKNILRQQFDLTEDGSVRATVNIDSCELWSPEHPVLYDCKFQLVVDDLVIDEYVLPIGIREIRIEGDQLLLNNKAVYLKGFGKHEDFSVVGKGLLLPLMVKDFELMKWMHANSFRTSHYPYSEEMMYYADKKGIMVIGEVPAVSLDVRCANERTLRDHKEYIERLVERDYNHPSIIMWAAGNEPNLVGAKEYYDGSGKKYWKEIFTTLRSLDSSRPLTVPNCTRAGIDDPVFEFCDVLCLNRYYGWYEYPGNLEYAAEILSKEMDAIYAKYKKPVLFTEFGADTIPGLHSTSTQMFTEEYQAQLLEMYIRVIRSKTYTIGEQAWNFADFRTPQHFRRVVMNRKGVFTREREPKLAAFKLKELWGCDDALPHSKHKVGR
jgi:beta-glucuronidase